MLATFTVENFLSFRNPVTLSFVPTNDKTLKDEYLYTVRDGVQLLKIGIIYGANASGKTNLIHALYQACNILSRPTVDKQQGLKVLPFLLDTSSRELPSRFSFTFYVATEKYLLELEVDKQRIYSERLFFYPSSKAALLYERGYDASHDLATIRWGGYIGMNKKETLAIEGNTIPNMSVLAAWRKSNVEAPHLAKVYSFFSEQLFLPSSTTSWVSFAKLQFHQDNLGKLHSFVRRFLQASDFNISDIAIKEEVIPKDAVNALISSLPVSNEEKSSLFREQDLKKETFMFQHHTPGGVFELPEGLESTGTLQMLGLSIVLYRLISEQHFVVIDEIESSLHYELLSYFIRTFLASGGEASQMLLTTHDLNLLNEDYIRRDAIWFTHKATEASSALTRLSAYGLHKNVSPYNAYRQNKLAPLPFLGSQYFSQNED